MFASLKEVREMVETLNCNPQSRPKATEEPSNCTVETFSFFAFSKILSANFLGADWERTTNLELFSELSTCLLPRILLFPFIASFSAFSNIFLNLPLVFFLLKGPL